MRCCTTSSTTRCCTSRTCSSPCAATRCPWIPMDKRIEMEPLGHHCWQVIVHYGFKNDVDLPRALEHARLRGCQLEPMTTSYFLSRDVVIPTLGSGMAPWREKLFAQMHHNASGAADFLGCRTTRWWSSARRSRSSRLRPCSTWPQTLRRQGHRTCLQDQARRPGRCGSRRGPPFIDRRKDILMHILFIADPLEQFKIYKDTTFSMMREAQRRGHTLSACVPQDLTWQRGRPGHRAGARDHADRRRRTWFREEAVIERAAAGLRRRC